MYLSSLFISPISMSVNHPFVLVLLAWSPNRCSLISKSPVSFHFAFMRCRNSLLPDLLLIQHSIFHILFPPSPQPLALCTSYFWMMIGSVLLNQRAPACRKVLTFGTSLVNIVIWYICIRHFHSINFVC